MQKQIKGYEGLYFIDESGDIYSHYRHRKLKPTCGVDGYYTVMLTKNKKHKRLRVQRLVALAFINNPFNKPQTNHINGNKLDNRAENIEWVDNSENQKHAYAIGLKSANLNQRQAARKSGYKSRKLSYGIAQEIRELYKTGNYTHQELSGKFGISHQSITRIINYQSYREAI